MNESNQIRILRNALSEARDEMWLSYADIKDPHVEKAIKIMQQALWQVRPLRSDDLSEEAEADL